MNRAGIVAGENIQRNAIDPRKKKSRHFGADDCGDDGLGFAVCDRHVQLADGQEWCFLVSHHQVERRLAEVALLQTQSVQNVQAADGDLCSCIRNDPTDRDVRLSWCAAYIDGDGRRAPAR